MAVSALFILNAKGDIVISRHFREGLRRSSVDAFRQQVVAAKNAATMPPVLRIESQNFIYTREHELFFVAVTSHNSNAVMVLQYLSELVRLFRTYFSAVDEESLKDNFTLVYELLDETMDHGMPQTTRADLLKQYIKHGRAKDARQLEQESRQITKAVTGAPTHREGNIKYRRNEVYIDVLEQVNVMMRDGVVQKSDVSGRVMMRTMLSGMPECKVGINDKVMMTHDERVQRRRAQGKQDVDSIAIDDVSFHRCVRLGQFETERAITFVPPDGEFELMRYRITDHVNHPFEVVPIVREHGQARVEFQVRVRSTFSSSRLAHAVTVRIPCPPNTARCAIKTSVGKAKYDAANTQIVWKIKKFPGRSSTVLTAEAQLTQLIKPKPWQRSPLQMAFVLPMCPASGIDILYMEILEKSNYEAQRFVRYITTAGNYQIRF
ncbi:MAG: hypothetical protein MHM6MM_000230 [Cercozoa sp. M6MM]